MSDFHSERARREVAAAVKEVEQKTSCEIVVAVRNCAGHYRHVDYLAGALLGLGVLLILLFHPHNFAVATMPLDVLVMFGVGAAASAYSPTLRRLLSRKKLRAEFVSRAARATFVELGVSRTRGRTGILVYLAMLEQSVEVVCDTGVALGDQEKAFRERVAALDAAVKQNDLDAFVAGLRRLGEPLSRVLPCAADDVNELPDDLSAQ